MATNAAELTFALKENNLEGFQDLRWILADVIMRYLCAICGLFLAPRTYLSLFTGG